MDHNTNIIVTKEESKMQMQENEIVLYQPNDAVHLEVRMTNESVWLTQTQIALLKIQFIPFWNILPPTGKSIRQNSTI